MDMAGNGSPEAVLAAELTRGVLGSAQTRLRRPRASFRDFSQMAGRRCGAQREGQWTVGRGFTGSSSRFRPT